MNGICPAAATGEAVGEETDTVGTAAVEMGTEEVAATLWLSSPRSSPVFSLKLTLLLWIHSCH